MGIVVSDFSRGVPVSEWETGWGISGHSGDVGFGSPCLTFPSAGSDESNADFFEKEYICEYDQLVNESEKPKTNHTETLFLCPGRLFVQEEISITGLQEHSIRVVTLDLARSTKLALLRLMKKMTGFVAQHLCQPDGAEFTVPTAKEIIALAVHLL